MNFNRVIKISDFQDPDLQNIIQEIYGEGVQGQKAYRKAWEVAMALKTSELVKAKGTRKALGLGVGTEPTSFILTRTFSEVHATDLYTQAGTWASFAPSAFMRTPEKYIREGVEWFPERLIIQDMDMTNLRYPDNTFDFIYSSGSIEHISDNPLDIIKVVSECHRVLKKGGILSLSTEFKLNSHEGTGWPGVVVFDEELLKLVFLQGGNFDWADDPEFFTDEETMATQGSLVDFVQAYHAGGQKLPDVVLSHAGYIYTSVHLALVAK